MNRKYYAPYSVSYDVSGTYAGMYTENAELASVTVGSVVYPVKATVVPLIGVAAQPTMASIPSTRDVTFVLTAPLAIRRQVPPHQLAEAAHDFTSVDFRNNPAHRSKTFDPA